MQPHRWQPTRLPRPWDSPGKNTGVGCHFLLQCMKVKSESEVAQSCLTLIDPMDCSLQGSSIHGISQARVLEWVPLPPCWAPLNSYPCSSSTNISYLYHHLASQGDDIMPILQMGKLRLRKGQNLIKAVKQTSGRHRCLCSEPAHLTTSLLKIRRGICVKKVPKL